MWRAIAKLAVSALLLWLLLRHQNLAALRSELAQIDYRMLIVAALVYAALTPALALRWSAVLAALGRPFGFRHSFPIVMIGLFFSQMLPSGVGGDVARAWLARNAGLPLPVAVSSVLVERLAGVLALFVVVTTGLPALLQIPAGAAVTRATLLVLTAGYAGLGCAFLLDRLPAALDRFKLVRGLRQFAVDCRATLLAPRSAVPVLGFSFANQLGVVLVIFVLGQALGLSVGIVACLLIVPLSNLVQVLPISIAGWGVREGFLVAAFGMFGVAAEKAFALSVIFGLLTIVISLPGGVIWIVRRRAGGGADIPANAPLIEAGLQ